MNLTKITIEEESQFGEPSFELRQVVEIGIDCNYKKYIVTNINICDLKNDLSKITTVLEETTKSKNDTLF